MEFKNLINEQNKTVPKTELKTKTVEVNIDKVTVIFSNDPEEDFETVKTLDDVLHLDQKKPGIVLGTKPALYSVFRSAVNKTLEPYVKVGDKVKFRKDIYKPSDFDENSELIVTSVELVSLGNMSIFAARLSNGDHSILTNFLIPIK